jgi:hypothetical protein
MRVLSSRRLIEAGKTGACNTGLQCVSYLPLDCADYELEIQIFVFSNDPGHKIEIGRTGEADRYTRREHQSRLI